MNNKITTLKRKKEIEQKELFINLRNEKDLDKKKLIVEEIFEKNIKLVYKILDKYYNNKLKTLTQYDLFAEGAKGLQKAIENFDLDKGHTFSTFAYSCISNSINLALKYDNRRHCEISLNFVFKVDEEGGEITLEDTIEDSKDFVNDYLNKDEVNEFFNNFYDVINKKLKGNQRTILTLLHGLNGFEQCSRERIAKILGISPSYVSRLEQNAYVKIREEIKDLNKGKDEYNRWFE